MGLKTHLCETFVVWVGHVSNKYLYFVTGTRQPQLFSIKLAAVVEEWTTAPLRLPHFLVSLALQSNQSFSFHERRGKNASTTKVCHQPMPSFAAVILRTSQHGVRAVNSLVAIR